MDAIDEILVRYLDPEGAGISPQQFSDLYGQMSIVVADLLWRGASEEFLKDYLVRATEELGGRIDRDACARTAAELIALRV